MGIGLLVQFPCFLDHVKGEALKVAFYGQIGECSQVRTPFEISGSGEGSKEVMVH